MHSVLDKRKQWQKQHISIGKKIFFYNSIGSAETLPHLGISEIRLIVALERPKKSFGWQYRLLKINARSVCYLTESWRAKDLFKSPLPSWHCNLTQIFPYAKLSVSKFVYSPIPIGNSPTISFTSVRPIRPWRKTHIEKVLIVNITSTFMEHFE